MNMLHPYLDVGIEQSISFFRLSPAKVNISPRALNTVSKYVCVREEAWATSGREHVATRYWPGIAGYTAVREDGLDTSTAHPCTQNVVFQIRQGE